MIGLVHIHIHKLSRCTIQVVTAIYITVDQVSLTSEGGLVERIGRIGSVADIDVNLTEYHGCNFVRGISQAAAIGLAVDGAVDQIDDGGIVAVLDIDLTECRAAVEFAIQ